MSGVWYEYQDENGNTYFYNTETEEYVWELPEGATIAPTDAAATTETTETSSDQQKMEFLKAAIEGKISKLDPDVKKKLEMAKQQQLELKKKKDEAVAAGQEDWVEVYDPNSDAFYYYEIVSGNVVWEKPTSYVMAADNELIAAVIKIQCAYRTRLARHRVKSIKDDPTPLRSITDINGNHWKEQKDSSGTIYYLNDVTGESQWDPPKEAEKLDENASKWYCKTVEGTCFYYNRITGECVVEQPAEFDGDMAVQPPMIISKAMDKAIQKKSKQLCEQEEKKNQVGQEESVKEKVWIEIYDPKKNKNYYYGTQTKECRWEKPDEYSVAADDEMISAIITIQCAYRSRLARRKVASKRLSAQERLDLAEERMEQETKVSQEVLEVDQGKKESENRRRMLEEERKQCRRGDRYWGIDLVVQEILRQREEEKLMMEAEEYRRFLQEKARRRRELDRKKIEAESLKQRAEDSLNEEIERDVMSQEEKRQCTIDRFWGLEKDERDRQGYLKEMAIEDVFSRTYEREVKEHFLHQKWSTEAAIKLEREQKEKLSKEIRYQKQYLKMFKHAKSSDHVINYRWPTKTVVAPKNAKKKMFLRPYKSKVKGYPMDAVYDPERMTNPVNVFHVADSTHLSGRKGKLDITQTPNTFRLAEPSKESTTARFLRKVKADQWKKYNAMVHPVDNPAVEILSGKHEKNTTLPALESQKSSNNQKADLSSELRTFETERETLRKLFNMIDLDASGFINKTEMTWALTRDKQVRQIASSSVVLRPILKNRAIDALFNAMDDDGSDNVSWDEFESYCQSEYKKWCTREVERRQSKIAQAARAEKQADVHRDKLLADEEDKARQVFSLVDVDGSGTIDQNELMTALKQNRQVREFVEHSKALQPLLDNSMFSKAFVAMNTDDDDGISVDEFVAFCTEVASIVLLNDL